MNSSRSLQTESVICFVISLRLVLQMCVRILQKLYAKKTKHTFLSFPFFSWRGFIYNVRSTENIQQSPKGRGWKVDKFAHIKYKICNKPITCPVQSDSSKHLTFWMDRLRRCGKNVNKHSRKNSKEIVCITKNMELIMHLREVHGSTYILAEGLSPSGLSFCHLYGFCAVSKAQASDKTSFPAQYVTWIRKLYKNPLTSRH